MARPTDKPRLATLDPAAVAREAAELVLHYLHRLTPRIALGAVVTVLEDRPRELTLAHVEQGDLALTLRQLTLYAQRGDLGDWGDPAGALDALQSACEALYAQPGVPGTFGLGELGETAAGPDGEPDSALAVVLLAAHARWLLSQGEEVSPRELAALAGRSVRQVRHDAAEGYLRAAKGDGRPRYTPGSAKRWLARLDVAGFASEKAGT